MIEGRMNGVAEAHHGQSMFGFGFPMNPSYANFVKDAQHYGRQLPHEIKVTNAGYHGPYVGAEHQTPMNLVQKDMPPETNGYAAFSHRNVGAPPFPNMFYSTPSFIPGPYTPHQQVHFTPHKSPYTTPSTPIAIPISRPGPESSPIEVKTSSASMNGENHAFKKPDESNSRYYLKNKPRKRQHVPTPAPIPVPITTTAPSMPPIIEQPPQPQVLSQSQLQSPLQPTLIENAELPKMENFGANHLAYFGFDPEYKNQNKIITKEECRTLCERGELVPIEKVTVQDWEKVMDTEQYELKPVTVKKISELQTSDKCDKVVLSFLHDNQRELGNLEVEVHRPFFVLGRGWNSYLPDRTREKCKGMHCGKINEGDVVLIMNPRNHHNILTPKNENKKRRKEDDVPTEQHPKKRRIHKLIDLNENRNSDYHEFTNNTSNCNVSIAQAAANAAVNRNTVKRQGMENDSNNNNETIAKRKRSAEEASKATARRWSDSCLEKTC